jgi:hypothetical protein
MVQAARALGFALTLTSMAVLATACANSHPIAPSPIGSSDAAGSLVAGAQARPSEQSVTTSQACWGQASQVFARMGLMGEHSSSSDTPRPGLRNLARAPYEQGILTRSALKHPPRPIPGGAIVLLFSEEPSAPPLLIR